ncbi:MAG: 50S ribosomal protein L11 methyltransferase [Sphingomonadaceae bacterium]
MTDGYKLTLPCTRAEAEAIRADIGPVALIDPLPVLMTSEPDPKRPDDWLLEIWFESPPDAGTVAALRALVPSAADAEPAIETVPERDWTALSQEGLEPIAVGRFFVHLPQHRERAPADRIALEIDASRAFGTGHHETTSGCLAALDRLKRRGFIARDILDLGTGTGLLAFAALGLWPTARVLASDLDPVAIEVARANAAANGIRLGRGPGRLELALADGLDHCRLAARAPFDLVIANILAGPLIGLAPDIANALAPGARLVLAGLLDGQESDVLAAYRRERMTLLFRLLQGEWPVLVMRRR